MTKLVLIGTGTPNPDPYRSGPCVGVYHNDKMYLVDFGVGLVRQINAISKKLNSFKISQLNIAFLTHLHSDHTLGLSDLLITPWILGRTTPLRLYGPKGLDDMSHYITKAYSDDIIQRINGLEKANPTGYKSQVVHIQPGLIYDEDIKVYAIPVNHGQFESYAYKFVTEDKTIVISGDTAPCDSLVQAALDCDILVHEVYYTKGLESRSPQWQKYHQNVHTSAIELGKIASKIKPKQLVLYHQLFMQENILDEDMTKNNELYKNAILNEVKMHYNGNIIYGEDLMIIK